MPGLPTWIGTVEAEDVARATGMRWACTPSGTRCAGTPSCGGAAMISRQRRIIGLRRRCGGVPGIGPVMPRARSPSRLSMDSGIDGGTASNRCWPHFLQKADSSMKGYPQEHTVRPSKRKSECGLSPDRQSELRVVYGSSPSAMSKRRESAAVWQSRRGTCDLGGMSLIGPL